MAEISETSLSNLPKHLVEYILSHIQDVNSVGRLNSYKSVSKTWRSFFSSHQFARSHVQMHNHGPECILFLDDRSGEEDRPADVPKHSPYVATLGDQGVAKKLEHPFLKGKNFRWPFQVQGSCHGLVLLFYNQDLVLVNPTTLDALEIPHYGGGISYGYGLGYDSCTDDYKLVSIQKDNVDIYSVKTRTWRTVPNSSSFRYGDCWKKPFVNNRIYFVSPAGVSEADSETLVLAAFNVATEEFESVPYPKGVDDFRPYDDRFLVLGGCLTLAVVDKNGYYDVWLMKEDFWTKLTIKPDFYKYRPICFAEDDENEMVSLVAEGRKFVAHNWETGVCRDMVVDGMPDHSIWGYTAASFRLSFISPNYNYGESLQQSDAV